MLLLAVLVGLFAAAAAPQSQQSPQSPLAIDRLVSDPSAQPAFWGVYVEDLSSGDPYYGHNPSNAFLPASNQKVLTSATALDALGSDYRYRTVLYFDGSVDGDALVGDLVLRGTGDPTFGSVTSAGPDPLREWAERLAEMGVRRIEGRIVGDDDAFDDQPYAEGWDIDYVTSQASRGIGVSIGGLAYRDNVVEVKITANGTGRAPDISTRPDGFLQVRNQLMTANRSRGIAVETYRDFGSESIVLQGSIPRSYDGTIVIPVTNPTSFTVNAFVRYLESAGIEVASEPADIDMLDGYEYETDVPIFVHLSPPLAEILRVVNKESNNFFAEQVFRSLAPGGSASNAEIRVKQLLNRAGAATNAIEIRDGSGLSRKNMITPEAMGRLLAFMHEHPEREAFVTSLAEGGEPESTLRYRLNNTSVQAKTGSLEFVRALSGYVTTPGGRTLAFCIVANNYSAPSYQITQTIDRIVMELASAAS
jgi:D-alanyl-D-alanine carboxypeptidase/D-alanyl-D-alanine-endopeptidase (penicillin-binding protein 4)